MASYNPAMIKDEPLTADWKAAPDLTSFSASYAANSSSSAASATGAGSYGAGASTGSAVAGASASSAAGNTANGAGTVSLLLCGSPVAELSGQVGIPSGLAGIAGLLVLVVSLL